MTDPTLTGAALIAMERQRQPYDADHDDSHIDGELVRGAVEYLGSVWADVHGKVHRAWPWTDDPKLQLQDPSSPYPPRERGLRDLVRAGALVAAEIDRRLRAGETEG